MKKMLRWMSLVLAAVVVLSVTALAEDERNGATITDKFTGSTAVFAEGNDGKIQVTVTSPSIVPDNQYTIVMVKGSGDNPVVTESKILYMDQKSASDAGGTGGNKGTLTFDIYPASIQDSTILIAGVFQDKIGQVVLAVVNGKFILGDVNGDGEIDALDASAVLRYSVKLYGDSDSVFSTGAADVNKNGSVTSADASIILQHIAGLLSLLN